MTNINFIFLFYIVCFLIKTNKGQCPAGTTISFEKISNVNIRGINLVPLYTGVLEHMSVSAECNNRCRAGPNCRAFIINYSKFSCVGIGYDSESSGISMVVAEERTSYFDKICLSVAACEKAWTFERVIGRQLIGFDDRILNGVVSRLRCEELCLKERQFVCRSGEYDHATLECRLSKEDRRTQSSHFITAPSNVDYFENQCVNSHNLYNLTTMNSSQSYPIMREQSNLLSMENLENHDCGFQRLPGVDLQRADLLRTAYSEQQCEQLCEATKAFICRSFSFKPALSQCSLNSDDSYSVGGQQSLIPVSDAVYFERSNCVNLNLDCKPDAMEIHLNTIQPFNGKIYAKEDPVNCETVARSFTTTSLVLPIQGKHDSNCGVKSDSNGKYSTTIVIQYHPLIQRKGDRIVRLVCNFETSTQVVTNNYHVLSHVENQGSTVVNASATSPEIRLRITDSSGQDVQGTKLGEQLQLRIELKNEDSALDMQATHLIAMSGHTQQQIALIDHKGCSTDLNIFPGLEKLPGSKTLVGRFDAFKFADDVVVRFQVNVHFCVNRCPPLNCAPTRNSIDTESIEENELGTANERASLAKEEDISAESIHLNSTENPNYMEIKEEFNGKKIKNKTNRVRRETRNYRRNEKEEFKLNKSIKSNKILPDTELQGEIIVEGLTANEHNHQARSLYTKNGPGLEFCTSKNTLIILAFIALIVQVTGLTICCVCYRNQKINSNDQLFISQFSNLAPKHSRSNNLVHTHRQINKYFSQID